MFVINKSIYTCPLNVWRLWLLIQSVLFWLKWCHLTNPHFSILSHPGIQDSYCINDLNSADLAFSALVIMARLSVTNWNTPVLFLSKTFAAYKTLTVCIKNTKVPPELASSLCKTLFLLFHPLPNCCNLWHLNEILDTISSGGNLWSKKWENSCGSDSFKDTRRVPLDRIMKGDLLLCKPHLIGCPPHFLNSRLHRELALAKAIAHNNVNSDSHGCVQKT